MFNRMFAVLLLSGFCAGQTASSNPVIGHEELVVRTAYARLGCAAQIGSSWSESNASVEVKESAYSSPDRLQFELSHFQSGELRSLSTLPWTALISGPVKLLEAKYHDFQPVDPISNPRGNAAGLFFAEVDWRTDSHETVSDLATINKVVMVPEYVRALQQPNNGLRWTRYATYTVVARMGKHSATYRATFLFSGNGHNEEAWPLDYATGMTIARVVGDPLDPATIAKEVFASRVHLQTNILRNENCRWLIRHKDDCCALGGRKVIDRSGSRVPRSTPLEAVEACRKTGVRLPEQCSAGDRQFSDIKGNLLTLSSDSVPEFNCTWVCVQDRRRNLKVIHGPWALALIDGRTF